MNTFNLKKIALAGILAMSLAACNDGVEFPSNVADFDGNLTVEYEIDGEMPLSRGVPADPGETKLEKMYVLFFDKEDNERFVNYKPVGVMPGKNTVSFDAPQGIDNDKDYRLLIVGNADPYCTSGDYAETLRTLTGSYADIAGSLKAERKDAVTKGAPGLLPMYGEYVDADGEEVCFRISADDEGKTVVSSKGKFFFSRALCRFDILNLVPDRLDVVCARVVNDRDAGLFFMDGLNPGNQKELMPTTAPSGGGYMPVTRQPDKDNNRNTQHLEGSLYAFPNALNTSVVNDIHTTALMIAGYFTDDDGKKDSELTYYRFNLANAGEAQMLQRNFCYRATIKGVVRRGEDNEKDAYNGTSPVFVYDVDEEWGTDNDNVASDGDGNFLIVNKTHLTFGVDANEADFVDLRISTNPELTWVAQWVEEQGHENGKFSCEKVSNQVMKVGPNEKNETPYVRYGYLKIVATNPKSGKKLEMPIYLMQLSVLNNVKTLTVNGNTKEFTQEMNPMGGSVSLKVVTGSMGNMWKASEDDNYFINWQGCKFTGEGDNNNDLEIVMSANTTGKTRTATIIVRLVDNDFNPDGSKKVPDVAINIVQEPSTQLLDIINYPSSGTLELDCFSTAAGNGNGVVQQRDFSVELTDPKNYYFKVESTFDKARDLCISYGSHRGIGSSNPAYASHPADANGEPLVQTDAFADKEMGTFWINPFRTGPNDPTITGQIIVTAYPHRNGDYKNLSDEEFAKLPTERRAFTVKLKSKPVEINDVVVFNDATQEYHIIADRNYGAPCRTSNEGKIITSMHYDADKAVSIHGLSPLHTQSRFLGITLDLVYGQAYQTDERNYITKAEAESRWYDTNKQNGGFYAIEGKWKPMSSIGECDQSGYYNTPVPNEYTDFYPKKFRMSKGRGFFISDFKNNDGKNVCCWMPTPATGYITTDYDYNWNGRVKSVIWIHHANRLLTYHGWDAYYKLWSVAVRLEVKFKKDSKEDLDLCREYYNLKIE